MSDAAAKADRPAAFSLYPGIAFGHASVQRDELPLDAYIRKTGNRAVKGLKVLVGAHRC
jgi:hypothetical protein